MDIRAIKTPKVYPGNALETILDAALPTLKERDIVAITSKIISLCENSIIRKSDAPDKKELIHAEADAHIPDEHMASKYGIYLTIKNGLLIPTAGIDESNTEDAYILYPRDIIASATHIWTHLKKKHRLQELGILITDSTTTPLRYGVTGIGIGWCGFQPLYSYIGQPDCFGRPLRMTKVNILDALAASAVFVMGEGAEQTPIAIISDAPRIDFVAHPPTEQDLRDIFIAPEDDLYAPLLTSVPWVKSKRP